MVVVDINTQKEWWKSRTFWANTLFVIAGLFLDLSGYIQSGGAITFIALVNLFLRSITKQELKFS